MSRHHFERHYVNRVGWLRAAVLGANDGIVSVASLLLGVAATHAPRAQALTAGLAGLVAGSMSMAAGEYVSVSSQADSEQSDLERERRELESAPQIEHAELAGIYVQRGLQPALADVVATQLMAHNALEAHARDELGLTGHNRPLPLQAALASGSSFATGALLPLLVAWLSGAASMIWLLAGSALLALAVLGMLSARTGGSPMASAALRVTLWGGLAMALTAAVGALVGSLG